MVGLLDIAPASETVEVRGSPVDVLGVSIEGVARLLFRFPALYAVMSGREVGAGSLMEVAPDAVAAIIAAGTGAPGNADAEKVAASLSMVEQADLLASIIRLTMPGGFGPFVEKVNALIALLGVEAFTEVPDTKSRKPSKAS